MEGEEKIKKVEFAPMLSTERQQRLAQEIVDSKGKIDREAVLLKVGYAPLTARKKPKEIFNSEGLQNALLDLGITPSRLLRPAQDAMDAKKGTFFQGEYCESDAPDHTVRLKGSDQIAEIMGLKKQVIENRNVNVNVEFDDISHML